MATDVKEPPETDADRMGTRFGLGDPIEFSDRGVICPGLRSLPSVNQGNSEPPTGKRCLFLRHVPPTPQGQCLPSTTSHDVTSLHRDAPW